MLYRGKTTKNYNLNINVYHIDIQEREDKLMKLDQHPHKKIEEMGTQENEPTKKLDDISARGKVFNMRDHPQAKVKKL